MSAAVRRNRSTRLPRGADLLPPPQPGDRGLLFELRAADLPRVHDLDAGGGDVETDLGALDDEALTDGEGEVVAEGGGEVGRPDPFAAGSPAIVFTGTMDYRPNVEAVSFFANVASAGSASSKERSDDGVIQVVTVATSTNHKGSAT